MSNSPLVSYTKLSPCNSGQRTMAIDRITPHVVVGQLSVETIGACFDHASAQASCNYGIGSDGRVMLCVPENQRSWCSSSGANDQRAVTIECASDRTHPYAINNTVYNKLIDLCVDICQRNGKNVLLWLGGKGSTAADKAACEGYTPKSNEMILTAHRFYAQKACPGDYVYARLGNIASEVTKRLGGKVAPVEEIKYKVRLTWDNEKSQLGAYIKYDKAVEKADENPGYTVFNLSGKALYTSKGLPSVEVAIANQTKEKSLALLSTLPDYKGLPDSKEDYLNKVSEIAVKLYPYTRFLPSVVIAQAFLENGGGVANDALELTKRSNLIGQKAELLNNTWQDQTVWDGTKFNKRTPEVYEGVPTIITAAFRVFPNYAYSILDYELFITHAKLSANKYKYRDVIGMTDPQKMITEIGGRGYATGPTYPTSIMRVINQYDLTKYDKIAIKALQDGADGDIPVIPTPTPVPQPTPTPTPSTESKKVYRVQVGVFSNAPSRDVLINDIKEKLDLSCFYENNGGKYYVYCGSFENRNTAVQRVTKLKSKGFDAFVKEVTINV